jgi:RNA polymerase sigma-70 factor (ECF subfamily)
MAPLGQMEVGVAPGLEEKQTVSEILMVVQTLPKNQREVIYLKFQCDLSYKEISDITKLSVTNVGFLIHTAVRNIRQQILSETTSQTSRNTQAHPVRRIQ